MNFNIKILNFKDMTTVQKIFVLLLSVISGVFIYNSAVNSEVLSKDCSNDISHECVHSAIAEFDYLGALETLGPEQYSIFGRMLVEAGYYQKASEIILYLDRPSNPCTLDQCMPADRDERESFLRSMAVLQIAEKALKEPDKVASFEPIEHLANQSTIISNDYWKGDNKAINLVKIWWYRDLLYMLVGGSDMLRLLSNDTFVQQKFNYTGYHDYFPNQYLDKMAVSKFKPNKTWDHVIESYVNLTLSMNIKGSWRSYTLLNVATLLEYAGHKEQAYKILKLVKTTDGKKYPPYALIELLEKLKKYQDAKIMRKEFLPKFESLIADAKSMKEKNDFQKARILLLEAVEEIINDPYEVKEYELKRVSLELYKIGESDLAMKVADKSYEIDSSSAYIDYLGYAQHYRTIGQKEKAESLLNIAASSKRFYNSDSDIKDLAYEYYMHGHLDLAAKTIYRMGKNVSFFRSMFGIKTDITNKIISNFWKHIYVDAIISGKDTKEILIYAGKEVEQNTKFQLASYYLDHAQYELGEKYLSEAINLQGSACLLAYLANSIGRTDLVELHFNNNLKAISEEKSGIDRQMAYLQLVGCHNQIRIDRLRHQYH